jgi:hypothetical protein
LVAVVTVLSGPHGGISTFSPKKSTIIADEPDMVLLPARQFRSEEPSVRRRLAGGDHNRPGGSEIAVTADARPDDERRRQADRASTYVRGGEHRLAGESPSSRAHRRRIL